MKKTASGALALALLMASSSGTGAAPSPELRVFTSQQGSTLKARFSAAVGDQVTIVREDGRTMTLPLSALSAADQEYVRQQSGAPAPAGTAAGPVEASPSGFKPAPNPNDKLAVEEVNSVAGQPLFSDKPLWERPAAEVAAALGLRQESKTPTQSSYRSYPKDDYRLFGARPYSVALYAAGDRVTALSIVYANKGDLFGSKGSAEMHFDKDTPPEEAAKIVKTAMDKDLTAITETMSGKLGAPKKERFGEGKVGRMNMQRWDWRGQAVLLAEAEGEYVGLQVVTAQFADSGGKVARTSDAVIREQAKKHLENRPNGDVVIKDIPMVDQGPKGYCVPATAERAMRYLGVPADMYILANAGETGFGGGTSVNALLQGVGRHIKAKGRSFDSFQGDMKIKDLARHIDKGVPVIWALYSTDGFNKTANERTAARKDITDWAAWKQKVTTEAAANALSKNEKTGHVVLIIGYNKDTNEIAFSDSWGERYMERWITVDEANKVSQNSFYTIGF
ncbi:C39 family peptidase [Verrucomicrobium sp. BvORR034]|jgi:hypothetical protein|uniref:C39 family peptidase n=1 Tax=Verrucomicrobium sp. BvORR034 TaxID=1396418 RepID=UPI000678C972|nr:C39 family peptidase [Verrucomicrobium sp. BvORR034]